MIHEAVVEVAVVGVGSPSEIMVAVVLHQNHTSIDIDNLTIELRKLIKTSINPLFHINRVVVMDTLPRTASNKVMRRVIRDSFL
jgi:acyl-coenzyme A synthetase/AMP-(fatty) acid ligase